MKNLERHIKILRVFLKWVDNVPRGLDLIKIAPQSVIFDSYYYNNIKIPIITLLIYYPTLFKILVVVQEPVPKLINLNEI